jgi:D-beta-D-heptose 7-phosphate kinase/D-beta-D-heptose 1-phosphate adenosyltransferase
MDTIKEFKNRRVLVIGDLILDRFIWGRVNRISPEAPVPVVDVEAQNFSLGGAANVASNIVSLGGNATVMGIVGRDRAAERIREILDSKEIDFMSIEDERPTTVKTRVIAHNQQVVRFDQESREKLSGRSLKAMLSGIDDAVRKHDAVIVSDYMKGVVTRQAIERIIKAAGRKFVAVDPKVGHFNLYKGVSLITPNLNEASEGSGIEIRDIESLKKAGMALLKKTSKAVLITRGEGGMSLFEKGKVSNIPTLAKHVYDVTGAGDTVIAVFAMAYASGASLTDAAVISNHAAGIVVGEVGTATATPMGLRRSLKAMKIKIETESV